jgi:hypothetical protein
VKNSSHTTGRAPDKGIMEAGEPGPG